MTSMATVTSTSRTATSIRSSPRARGHWQRVPRLSAITGAIWSHSWYAFSNRPAPDGRGLAFNPDGGVRIGNSDYWVGKYTIQPENGGGCLCP